MNLSSRHKQFANLFHYQEMRTLVKCLTLIVILTYGDPCIIEAIVKAIMQ
jgi:hypothetical protein